MQTEIDGGKLGQASKIQRLAKRTLDIAVSATALMMLAPLFAAVAAIIKLTSRGPVFYTQQRIGQFGVPFEFVKFRSMRVDAHDMKTELDEMNEAEGPIFKIKDDPRITKIGKIIRSLSIDELPQLMHVLSGKMTLVGPRPHLPEEVAEYTGEAHRRLAVRPGLTGIWQVSGRSDLDFDTWIEMDLEYIDTWSLKLDMELLAKTVPAVLSGRGAY